MNIKNTALRMALSAMLADPLYPEADTNRPWVETRLQEVVWTEAQRAGLIPLALRWAQQQKGGVREALAQAIYGATEEPPGRGNAQEGPPQADTDEEPSMLLPADHVNGTGSTPMSDIYGEDAYAQEVHRQLAYLNVEKYHLTPEKSAKVLAAVLAHRVTAGPLQGEYTVQGSKQQSYLVTANGCNCPHGATNRKTKYGCYHSVAAILYERVLQAMRPLTLPLPPTTAEERLAQPPPKDDPRHHRHFDDPQGEQSLGYHYHECLTCTCGWRCALLTCDRTVQKECPACVAQADPARIINTTAQAAPQPTIPAPEVSEAVPTPQPRLTDSQAAEEVIPMATTPTPTPDAPPAPALTAAEVKALRLKIIQQLNLYGFKGSTKADYEEAVMLHVGLVLAPDNFALISERLQHLLDLRAAAPPPPKVLKDYLVNIHGKDYVQFTGLLALAHERGLHSLKADFVTVTEALAIATATAIFADGRSFSEAADATPENVNPGVKKHFARCALTRAKARALRDALNISEVAMEELEA